MLKMLRASASVGLAVFAGSLLKRTIVDWNWAVTQGKVQLPDGLHPDAAGYEYRSRMIATAVARRCPAGLPA